MRFLDHLTLGQYVPVDSFVHRLDPRCKILSTVFLLTGIFFINHPLSFVAWALFLILIATGAKLPLRLVFGTVRPVLILVLFTVVINLFFTPGHDVWRWGLIHITEEGIAFSLRMGFRLFFLILYAGLLTLTTSPMELSDGLESLLSPFARFHFPAHEMAMMMTIALRFIPTLLDETDRIMKAQLSRGADLDSGGLFKRLKAFIPILVPLFVIVFQRAEDLAIAMESRCYRGGKGRTRMKPLVWKVSDSLVVFAVVLVIVGLMFLDRWI